MGRCELGNLSYVIRSSKTEHHAHGGVRIIPIFAELRPYLEEVWNQAEERSVRIITRYEGVVHNFCAQLERWTPQAGIQPWVKPFQNMRVSCATELADKLPSHVSVKWLGHTEKIVDEFYRNVTDEHYQMVIGSDNTIAITMPYLPISLFQAAQNAAHTRRKIRRSRCRQPPAVIGRGST